MTNTNLIRNTLTVALTSALAVTTANAAVFVKYDGVDGESQGPGDTGTFDWYEADSFSFGVEREMKESGEKGGTADINIGVGELQECTIKKSMDSSTVSLAQAAVSGRTLGSCEVCITDDADTSGQVKCIAYYVMERCYVKSWSTSTSADDRPTEEVAFYYNKIAFGIDDGREEAMNWDNEKNRPWSQGQDWILRLLSTRPPR